MYNTDYTLELVELNAIFGFPNGGERRYPRIFNEHAFWCRLSTASQFVSSDSKESHIHYPCFRYAHRLLAHTLFAMGDNTVVVRKSELLFMWSMVNDFHLDSGAWLARQLIKVGKASLGNIAIGGLITTIALHFNIPLEDYKPILGTSRIDLDMLVNNEMLVKRDGQNCLVMNSIEVMPPQPLPNPAFTSVYGRDIWTFLTSDAHHSSPPPFFPPFRVPSSTVESHAEAFTRIHQSLTELHLQQQHHYNEFEQFRDSQLLHQQHVKQLLHDTMALLRPHH